MADVADCRLMTKTQEAIAKLMTETASHFRFGRNRDFNAAVNMSSNRQNKKSYNYLTTATCSGNIL